MYKLDFEKLEEPEIKWLLTMEIDNIHWITEKAREFQKNIYFWFMDYVIAFDGGSQKKKLENLKKKNENTRPPYLYPEKPKCRSRHNS